MPKNTRAFPLPQNDFDPRWVRFSRAVMRAQARERMARLSVRLDQLEAEADRLRDELLTLARQVGERLP